MANPPSESAAQRFARDIATQPSERKSRGWDNQTAERRNRRYVAPDGTPQA